jgi:hypothetical protein
LKNGKALGSEEGKVMGNELCCEQRVSIITKPQIALFLDVHLFAKLQIYVNNIMFLPQRKHTVRSITNINSS